MGGYTQRVRDSILPLSVAGTLPAAFGEWSFAEKDRTNPLRHRHRERRQRNQSGQERLGARDLGADLLSPCLTFASGIGAATNSGCLLCYKVVHHDDVPGLTGWDQRLLDVSQEDVAVVGPVPCGASGKALGHGRLFGYRQERKRTLSLEAQTRR